MARRRWFAAIPLLLVSGLVAACGQVPGGGDDGEDYPTREITFIIPYSPGGSTDPVGRQFATQLENELGVSVVVENRPGGSATVGTSAVVTAEPDGYTIGLTSSSGLILQSVLGENVPYHEPDDYQLLAKFADLPPSITVRSDAPWDSIEEFLQDAKANPGEIRVSTSGELSTPDLDVRALNEAAGVELSPVPFSGGGGEALQALLGGRVEATNGYPATIKGVVDAGEVKVLGTFSEEPFEYFPDSTPLGEYFDETGLAPIPSRYFAIAPADIPQPVLDTLLEASDQAVNAEEFADFAHENGYLHDPVGPDELGAQLERDRETYTSVLESLGVEVRG